MIIRTLSVLLAVQLALTIVLYWPRDAQRGAPDALISGLAADAVQRISVEDGDSTVNLRRDGRGWVLGGEAPLPADTGKVDALIAVLTDADPGYAIAQSKGAARRFEVAEDAFQRQITLESEAGSAVAYLGTSPAFRKIHARTEGSDSVYVIAFNSYDAPTSAEGWLDRGLLAARNVDLIGDGEQRFALAEGTWTAADGEAVDSQTLESLVQALSSLRVTGLASDEDRELAAQGEERLSLTLRSGGEPLTLRVTANEERYFLLSSAYDVLFPTSSYDAERLLDAAAALFAGPEADATADTPLEDAAVDPSDAGSGTG